MIHDLNYTDADNGRTYSGQPAGYRGMLLPGCICGAKDGRWFRAGAKARIQGAKFMEKHLRRNQ